MFQDSDCARDLEDSKSTSGGLLCIFGSHTFVPISRMCKQYCHVGNTAKQCRLGLFQDSDFAGDLEDSKSTSGGTLCVFGSHTFVPKKLDVQETDISLTQLNRIRNHLFGRWIEIRRDSSSRFVGFGYRNVSFFPKPTQQHQRSSTRKLVPTQHDNLDLNNVDCVPSNAKFSRFGAMLYIFGTTY